MAGVLASDRYPETVNEALLAAPARLANASHLPRQYDGDRIDRRISN